MKKRTRLMSVALATALTAGSVGGLAACKGNTKPLTDEPLNAAMLADFTSDADARKEFFASGSKGYSWENGEPFNVWWKPENVAYNNGKMQLAISEMPEKEQKWDEETGEMVDVVADYYGAESRTEHYYGFGDFQVRMKPSAVTGTASTFFTCTGPYDKWYEDDGETIKKTNEHDEIDIEFLGKDTTKVQFNYFANGQGGHEYMYDLGFDASEEFHNYGFRWTEDYITWFVDETPVYRVDRPEDGEWPEDPGRVIMNYWCGTDNASAWMGEFADDYTGKAEYEWVKTGAAQQPDPNTAHIKPLPPVELEVPSTGWTDIDYSGFDGWGMYEVDKTDGVTIFHEEPKTANSFACCGSSLENSYSWVKFTVTNNDENDADIRMDFKKESGSGAVAAVVSENDGVSLNKTDSAVSIKLDGEESADVAVKIKDSAFIDQMVVFLNSTSVGAETGSITITELKGIVNENVEAPEPPQPNEDGTVAIDIGGFDGWGMYEVDKTNGLTISYEEENKKGTYNCCGMDLSSDYGVVKFTIKNNSDMNGAIVKIDVKKKGVSDGDNGVGGISTVTAIGGNENNYAYLNDYDNSAVIVIAADSELEITIVVKDDVTVDQLAVFLNSIEDDKADVTTGSITITELRGSAKTSTPDPGPGPDDPTTVPEFEVPEAGWEAVADNLDGWEMYTLERMPYSYYNGVRLIKKTPDSQCCGMDLDKKYTYFMFSVKNELGEPAEMRFDFKQKDVEDTGTVTAVMVNGKGVAIDSVYNAALVTVPANSFADVVIKLDPDKDMNQLVIFLNSLKETGNPENGKVVITDMRGIADPAAVTPSPAPTEGWKDISLDAFGGWDMYEVDKTDGLTISHEEGRADYNCCGMDLAENYSWIKFSVTNNGDQTARLRIDFKDKSNDSNPSFVKSVYPVMHAVRVKENKGGKDSYSAGIAIGAGETIDIVLELDGKYFDQMVIFMNSLPDVGKATAGSITVTGLKGIVNSDIEHVDPNATEKLDLTFGGHSSYTINKSDEGTNVSYSNVQFNSFVNMHAEIKGNADKYNTLKMTVKNNGEKEILLRVAICKYYDSNDNTKEDRNVCNTDQALNGPYYQDGRGGTYVVIQAGEEATLDFKYTNQGGEREPREIYIYIDSSKKDGGETRTGDITFKEFVLANT